jgi:hypothetical protein
VRKEGSAISATQPVDPAHYTYRVSWSAEDDEFVAVCLELPSLSWLDASPPEALLGLQRVVADVVADMQATGERVPEPLADRPYSGRFNVRVPETLHRRLAVEAAEQGISLDAIGIEHLHAVFAGKPLSHVDGFVRSVVAWLQERG